MNDTSLEIIVPAGEPIDVDKLGSLFFGVGLSTTVTIEESHLVNVDSSTIVVSLVVNTAWRAFIEGFAKKAGESVQDSFLKLLRSIGSIVKGRKPPQWKGLSSGKVTVGQWGPLELKDVQN